MSQQKLIIFDLDGTLVDAGTIIVTHKEKLFNGAKTVLDSLIESGFLLAIATGKSLSGTNKLIEDHNFQGYFSSIQTPNNNPSKPNPEMIFQAINMTGIDRENTIMIGDTVMDMNMARNANVRAIGVAWGYHSSKDLMAAGAEIVVNDFDQLMVQIGV